ncbi:peptidoglycan DD-metalloendopeptidase family protein [Staphylococcus gallinarum]|uniref:peptidoglycan DD-metalloendopeptidase family protein n=1 Tax=Staphylococcus gallinarum TaxID=1293 RepID=UPI000D1F14CD|nr:peptidoglycan DD-metalloendopeptidase family protein [Staphylococcus gallinarum]PTK94108.1 phage tail tape measure protein [Staphylococcus gallinarum]PTK96363.1 phage tail tape measure protein [Staphylococcus gallinarum]RIL22362.1 phage tail tape measure protein [Staphylococcus gallinarum]RIL29786.1 phage tail tape measure protein [Staphylococcus gallinarum]
MAERIKGLQIDLSMRDTGISKTLAGIKREFKSLNSSLKLSGNNFKYGEKSAESYKSRMGELDKAIKIGTSNLTELEQQYKKVSQEQGANSAKAVRLQTEYNKQANSINALKDEYGRLDQYYKENFTSMGQLSNKFKSVSTNMQEVGSRAQNVGQSLTSKITKPALAAGAALGGIAIAKGWSRLVEIDTAKAKLSALGNSAKDTTEIMDNAMASVKGTSFGMGEAATTAANAVAAGIKPGKELTQYLTTTGDAAAVAGSDMSEMGRIFNKVQTQNKAYNGELQELSDRGLPIYQWLAKEANVTGEEVTEMASKGEISSKMLQDAVRKNIGGAAKEMGAKSFSASIQNMWAAVGRLGAAFLDAGGKGGGFFSKLKPLMNNLTDTIDKMGPQAEQWGVSLGNAFNKVVGGINSVIKWYQSLDGGTQKTLGGIVKWLGITLVTMGPVLTIFGKFTRIIGGMFSGLSGLISFFIRHNAVAKISTASQAIWNGVTATAKGIANGYRYAIAALTTSQTAQAIKSKIAAAATVVWTGVTKAATLATKGLGLAIKFMTGPIGLVITAITALVGGIIYLWKTNSTFRNIVISAWNAIKNTAISVFGFLKPYIINIWNAIKNSSIAVWNTLKKVATTTWNGIKYAVQHPIQALKSVLSTLWNGMKNAAIKIWNALKKAVVAIIVAYVKQVRSNFNLVKRIVTTIFNAIKSFSIKVWNTIKNGVIKIVRSLKNGVTNVFNSLKKGISNIFNAVKSFTLKLWTNVKNGVISRAKALWNGVRNTFNSLKKGVSGIFNSVKSNAIKAWNAIKDKLTGIASSIWGSIKKTFNKMKDGLKGIIDKIKSHITGMVDKVKSGLNKLIEGVNWVAGKLGMDKLPKIKLHTGTEHTNTTTNVVKNGKIARDTFATVGDKGKGNGPGGFRHEMIRYPNGKTAITPNKDTTAFLPKGSSVMNGAQTHSMLSGMPQFSKGTLSNKKPKKHKEKDNIVGDVIEGGKALAGKVVDGGKAVVGKALETASKGKDWLKDKVGDVMDWIEKPGKLLEKVLEGFGVNMNAFGIDKAASLPFDMMKGMFGKLKNAAIETFKSWFDEQEGGDGGYIDLSKGINFPFSPNGKAPGYPFAGPHMGVDLNYKYDKLYSVLNGKATARSGWNGGFGNMVDIVKGNLKVIYGHMSKHAFSGSKNVKPGDYLGVSGNTGRSSGPHLHFEVQKNGVPIDPLKWLKQNDGGGGKSGKWSGDVKKALKLAGLPTTSAYINAWKKQIQTESGGNPKALGGTDGLADGRAKGLVQVKPGTFNAYKLPGHGNIWNGLDNLIAGMRYAKARYGVKGMLSAIGKGHGYATGGFINSSGLYNLAEEGYGEWIIPTDPSRASEAMKLLALASQDIEGKKKNKRPNQMRTPSTTSNSDNEMLNFMAQQLEATQRQVELLTQLVASNQRLEQKEMGFSERDVSHAQGKKAKMMAYNVGGAF